MVTLLLVIASPATFVALAAMSRSYPSNARWLNFAMAYREQLR